MQQKKPIKRLQGSPYVISLESKDELGRGSFGKVVRAYNLDAPSEQLVAKIMEISNQTNLNILNQEIQVLETFQSSHHNLVQYKRLKLYSKNTYYIIMEFCNGGTLEDKIKNQKRLTEKEILDFLCQFCSGYRELYQQKIIHRDLKPANILIHNRIYKIADFGLAKIVDQLYGQVTISLKGTPLYMAPELIQEDANADSKIDVWSLGIILYRLLFDGKFPFVKLNRKLNRELVFSDILQNNLEIPKNSKRSKELISLVSQMLEKKPSKRISWEEIFSHSLIDIRGPQEYDSILNSTSRLIASQFFTHQYNIQKVSIITMKPFKDKNNEILKGIAKVVTGEDITEESEHSIKRDKAIVSDIISDFNQQQQKLIKFISRLIRQYLINSIEDKLLFAREQIFFFDKTALRLTGLQRILKQKSDRLPAIVNQINIQILKRALELNQQLQEFKIDTINEDQKKIFLKSDNWVAYSQTIEADQMGLKEFLKDEIQIQMKLGYDQVNKPEKEYFGLINFLIENNPDQIRTLFITSMYLHTVINIEEKCKEFGFQLEIFWAFQEEIEWMSQVIFIPLIIKKRKKLNKKDYLNSNNIYPYINDQIIYIQLKHQDSMKNYIMIFFKLNQNVSC